MYEEFSSSCSTYFRSIWIFFFGNIVVENESEYFSPDFVLRQINNKSNNKRAFRIRCRLANIQRPTRWHEYAWAHDKCARTRMPMLHILCSSNTRALAAHTTCSAVARPLHKQISDNNNYENFICFAIYFKIKQIKDTHIRNVGTAQHASAFKYSNENKLHRQKCKYCRMDHIRDAYTYVCAFAWFGPQSIRYLFAICNIFPQLMRSVICEMEYRHCDKSLSQEINFFEHSHLVHNNLFRSSVSPKIIIMRLQRLVFLLDLESLLPLPPLPLWPQPNETANNWLKQRSLILLWLFLAQTL